MLPGLDRDEIREWYNGYNWLGEEKLDNPYDLLLLFRKREFMPYWFETGSPSFLVRVMMERGASLMDLENRTVDAGQLSRFDIENIDLDALLFQTGYLTIRERVRDGCRTFYTLDYPNLEVRQSLGKYLLNHMVQQASRVSATGKRLSSPLAANDFNGFAEHLKSFFEGIPYQWKTNRGPARYEAWYAGILYACFSMIGLNLLAEGSFGHGRSDMVVFHEGRVLRAGVQDGEGRRETRRNTGQCHRPDTGARLCGEVPEQWQAGALGGPGVWLVGAQPDRNPG